MVVVLIAVGLFTLEFIIPGLWSSIFKPDKPTPKVFRDPGLAFMYYERAHKLQLERKWKEAMEVYTQSIKFDPKQADYFNNRGLCFYFLKDYERACSDFSSAIDINSKVALYYEHRGDVYMKLGKKYEGLRDLRTAETLGSKDAGELITQYQKEERERAIRKQLDKQDDLPF